MIVPQQGTLGKLPLKHALKTTVLNCGAGRDGNIGVRVEGGGGQPKKQLENYA